MLNRLWQKLYVYLASWWARFISRLKLQIQLPQHLQNLLAQGGLEVETIFISKQAQPLYFRTQIQFSGDVIQSLPDPEQYQDRGWKQAWQQHYQLHQIQLKQQLMPLNEFKRALQSLRVALSSIVTGVILWWQDWQNFIVSEWQAWLQLAVWILGAALLAFLLFWLLRQVFFTWVRKQL